MLISHEETRGTTITLPTHEVDPFTAVYVPLIHNYILLPKNEWATFTVIARHEEIVIPAATLLHEGVQKSKFFQNERAHGLRGTSAYFVAAPRWGGDILFMTILDEHTGMKMIDEKFT
jgi:hypothetical protein